MTKIFFTAGTLYLLFVVYGSLVPLDYQAMPFQVAIDKFAHIPYLDLGPESRADWVANIILYIPLAFLWLGVFGRIRHFAARQLISLFVLACCLFVAVTVEFVQLYFPPRTVSLNDLLAETIGSILGVSL